MAMTPFTKVWKWEAHGLCSFRRRICLYLPHVPHVLHGSPLSILPWPGYSGHTGKCQALGIGAQWLSGTCQSCEKADQRSSGASCQAHDQHRMLSRHTVFPLLHTHTPIHTHTHNPTSPLPHSTGTAAPVFWSIWSFTIQPLHILKKRYQRATQEINQKKPQSQRM